MENRNNLSLEAFKCLTILGDTLANDLHLRSLIELVYLEKFYHILIDRSLKIESFENRKSIFSENRRTIHGLVSTTFSFDAPEIRHFFLEESSLSTTHHAQMEDPRDDIKAIINDGITVEYQRAWKSIYETLLLSTNLKKQLSLKQLLILDATFFEAETMSCLIFMRNSMPNVEEKLLDHNNLIVGGKNLVRAYNLPKISQEIVKNLVPEDWDNLSSIFSDDECTPTDAFARIILEKITTLRKTLFTLKVIENSDESDETSFLVQNQRFKVTDAFEKNITASVNFILQKQTSLVNEIKEKKSLHKDTLSNSIREANVLSTKLNQTLLTSKPSKLIKQTSSQSKNDPKKNIEQKKTPKRETQLTISGDDYEKGLSEFANIYIKKPSSPPINPNPPSISATTNSNVSHTRKNSSESTHTPSRLQRFGAFLKRHRTKIIVATVVFALLAAGIFTFGILSTVGIIAGTSAIAVGAAKIGGASILIGNIFGFGGAALVTKAAVGTTIIASSSAVIGGSTAVLQSALSDTIHSSKNDSKKTVTVDAKSSPQNVKPKPSNDSFLKKGTKNASRTEVSSTEEDGKDEERQYSLKK